MRKLISFLLRYSRGLVVLAITASIISGICHAGLIAVINAALGSGGNPSWSLAIAFVALCLILPATRFMSSISLIHLSQKAVFDLRMRLSRQILAAPLRHLEVLGAHRLSAALIDDVMVITSAVGSLPGLTMNMVIVIGCLIYLGWLSWMVLAAVVVFLALGLLSFKLVMKRAIPYLMSAREDQDALFRHLRGLTDGTKELKLHRRRRETFTSLALEATARSFMRHNTKGALFYTGVSNWALLLHFGLIGLLLFALPALSSISPGTLIGYTIIILYMMGPLDFLVSTSATLGRASVALNKIESLGLSLSENATEKDALVSYDPVTSWRSLELSNVSHSYHRESDNHTFTLGPIDFKLKPGELVFLVGGNGSGKTTLAKLLVGLYAPESGQIRLDGELIGDTNREQYRQQFSMVFSDFFIFESLLGLDGTHLDDLAQEYLVRLQLGHKVKVNQGVLSTTELSQGQRKRLALLTAYLEDRPIYVFDEWAADQDPYFKEVFYHEILPSLKARGKTIVVISHDDRFYHLADRIIKLDYGKLDYDTAVTPTPTLSKGLPAVQ